MSNRKAKFVFKDRIEIVDNPEYLYIINRLMDELSNPENNYQMSDALEEGYGFAIEEYTKLGQQAFDNDNVEAKAFKNTSDEDVQQCITDIVEFDVW